jgi:hypothetical protein
MPGRKVCEIFLPGIFSVWLDGRNDKTVSGGNISFASPDYDDERRIVNRRETMELSKTQNRLSWLLQAVVAVILLQTLFFKFTGAAESVYIFSALGAEPWGRIGSGVVELIAAILLLVPRTVALGALLSLGTICGALFAHLTKLGIALTAVGDRGELFALALVVFFGSGMILWLRRRAIPVVGERLFGQRA